MEDQVSPTDSIQCNEKFVTRMEKFKKLFDYSLNQETIDFKYLAQTKNEQDIWVSVLNLFKEIEKRHIDYTQQHMGKQQRMDEQEIQLLKIIVISYCSFHKIQPLLLDVYDWDQIGSILFNRHWKVCRSKWMESKATSIVEHPWSREEDQVLTQLYNNYAQQNKYNKWSLIAMEMSKICKTSYVRLGKQCRERWINKLNPQVERGPWYKEEEIKLMQAVINVGKKWSLISRKYFSNLRTENSLKNRFHTILKRESVKFEKISSKSYSDFKNESSSNNEEELVQKIITILTQESELQKEVMYKNRKLKNFAIKECDDQFNIIDNNFQIAIIKKARINIIQI